MPIFRVRFKKGFEADICPSQHDCFIAQAHDKVGISFDQIEKMAGAVKNVLDVLGGKILVVQQTKDGK